ncbi:hypothetical protein L6452_21979 [Arctium lappa]|uniref:Uncharacterized protein n=1 Tax=Arctium lappa TaxID=4217 RepID=A0ACB9B2V2_ARCLA|nr:hypothetical protein L6452_21979 [Arctium lappa]
MNYLPIALPLPETLSNLVVNGFTVTVTTAGNWEALDILVIEFAKSENLIEDSSPPASPLPSSSSSFSRSSSSYHHRLLILQIERLLQFGASMDKIGYTKGGIEPDIEIRANVHILGWIAIKIQSRIFDQLLGNLIVSNAGDCRAVMSRNGVAEALTIDHKPSRKDKKDIIESMGGYVDSRNGVWRIQGSLAVSRAIGDKHLTKWVIAEPETRILNIRPDCEFLILASDGIWDMVNASSFSD